MSRVICEISSRQVLHIESGHRQEKLFECVGTVRWGIQAAFAPVNDRDTLQYLGNEQLRQDMVQLMPQTCPYFPYQYEFRSCNSLYPGIHCHPVASVCFVK